MTSADYARDPIVVHDLFVRVYAERLAPRRARARTMVAIHADHTIVDHTWLWRADHDSVDHFEHGENPVEHALEVHADHVTVYALFAEHTMRELVLWHGEHGRIFFMQSELAYDAPAGSGSVAPGYVVTAQQHTAVGVGVYSYFFYEASAPSGFVATPNATRGFRNAFTHFLDGHGSIRSVLNGELGRPVAAAGQSSRVCHGGGGK